MRHSQKVHNSISQIASIRLQTELLLMNLEQVDAPDLVKRELAGIVDLTEAVQSTLRGLLADLHAQEQALDQDSH